MKSTSNLAVIRESNIQCGAWSAYSEDCDSWIQWKLSWKPRISPDITIVKKKGMCCPKWSFSHFGLTLDKDFDHYQPSVKETMNRYQQGIDFYRFGLKRERVWGKVWYRGLIDHSRAPVVVVGVCECRAVFVLPGFLIRKIYHSASWSKERNVWIRLEARPAARWVCLIVTGKREIRYTVTLWCDKHGIEYTVILWRDKREIECLIILCYFVPKK